MPKSNNKNTLLFSVIVPVYNVENWLEKCLESILFQKNDNYELIIVDDGSTDNSSNICDKYASENSNIVVLHKKNEGLVSARNAGLNIAKGEYVIYIDGDDWIKPNYFNQCQKILEEHINLDLIIFNYKCIYSTRSEIVEKNAKINNGYFDHILLQKKIFPHLMWNKLNWKIEPSPCNKIFKRDLLKKHICEDLSITIGEDVAFVYEYIFNCKNIFFFDKVLYCYNRNNSNSLTNTYGGDPDIRLYHYLFFRMNNELYNDTVKKQLYTFYLHKISNDYIVKPILQKYNYSSIIKKIKQNKLLGLMPEIKFNKILSKNYKLFWLCVKFKIVWFYYVLLKIKLK